MRFRVIFLICLGLFILGAPAYSFAKKEKEKETNRVYIDNKILAVAGAELDIKPVRVSKTIYWAFNFLSPQDLEERKKNLVNSLCRESKADILIDPQFSYSKRIFGGGKLTVSGYPANYKNFRNLSEMEIQSIVTQDSIPDTQVIFMNK